MLRKLVLFAITSGLAKKAWNAYQQKNAPVTGRTSPGRSRTGMGMDGRLPLSGTAGSGGRPDAS